MIKSQSHTRLTSEQYNVVTRFSRTSASYVQWTSVLFQPIVNVAEQRCRITYSNFERHFHLFLQRLVLAVRSIPSLFVTLSTSLFSMARKRPDRESRRRVEETSGMRNANGTSPGRSSSTSNGGGSNVPRTSPSAASSSVSPCGSSATTTPQPLQSTAESINSQSSASTPIVPTRPTSEGGRINRVLAPLLDMNADESVQGGQVPVEILDHLKSFMRKQEEFNQRLEQRIEDNLKQSQKGREKKSRRLPKALTVSLTLL